MDLKKRNVLVYALLGGLWLLVVGWQAEEHVRFKNFAKTGLRNRSKSIASTLGATIRGQQIRGAVFREKLQPVLNEFVNAGTNEVGVAGELVSVGLLNPAGEYVISAGRPTDPEQQDILQEGERWGQRTVTFVYPIEGASVTNTSGPILIENFTNSMNGGRGFRRGRPPEDRVFPPGGDTNAVPSTAENGPPPADRPPPPDDRPPRRPEDDSRPHRPFWARRFNDQEYQELIKTKELHGLVLSMPLDAYRSASQRDLWLRCVIGFFATLSVLGASFAWGNLARTSDLQLRLVRASELNSHLKEMNLAAAGLAHETRNPLNIIRGLAHVISKRPETGDEVREKAKGIVEEADKVAAQLNEFINYSRPREVRRTVLPVGSVVNEVARALSYDLEEKKIAMRFDGEHLSVEADEQMLRQALFNLILNAIQAVNGNGEIHVKAERMGAAEAKLEVLDNGPGVAPENRREIFKPYFTTQKTGTGLGLAVVHQIVLAHGWEIECDANQPQGALFRIKHLKVAA
jgi:signal transduction histidine kinase